MYGNMYKGIYNSKIHVSKISRGLFTHFLPYVQLCIGITEDGHSIHQNM